MKINVSTVYLYLPAKTQKWTKVDAFFVYFIFFSIFSLIPPSTCYYITTPFFQNTPFYQRLCIFFTFLTPFFTLFCTFSNPYNQDDPSDFPSKRETVNPQSPARTRGHRRPPLTSFILILVLTCERPLHLPKMGFWVCVYRY